MIPHRTAHLLAVATALFVSPVQPAGAQAARPSATMQAETRLPHISITTMGSGSPVVLIPGLSSPREVWAGVAPEIARSHRVLLVQVNGFGGDAPGENLKPGLLDGVVADLSGYLAAQKLGKVDVIGHSMGGLAALMLAKAHPDAVRRLMIVDALPFVGTLFVPNATVAMLEPQAAAMRDQMAAAYGKPADPAFATATANRLTLTPDARAKVVGWMGKSDPRVSAQAFYEDMTTDLRPAMAGIATPITLVVPYSSALPQERAEAIYRGAYSQAPHVSVVPVGDSAHFVMLDQPAAFAGIVRNFLK